MRIIFCNENDRLLNAFSTVTIHNLILRDGILIPQTFRKGTSRQGNICEFKDSYFTRSDGFPLRLPCNLPPAGNEHLFVCLGEVLGSGRVGTVHHATLLTHHAELPPLVIKISRYKRIEHMEKEAWFYEELEQIQGIAVPRCYGFFQARIEEGNEVSTWKADIAAESKEESYSACLPAPCDKIPERPVDPTLLSILLLERLGERMPLRQPLHAIESDVYEIYNDLSRLGIEHMDVRWSNILSVLQDPNGQSLGVVCPNHGHTHQWRIIDFDVARKTDGSMKYLDVCAIDWLELLFNNLPKGRIVEPWELDL
ncbi:hypothetical protein Clacol_009642 [Clathrus columnatus]|uniref:Protein kinase domain-containing protein n=1 Tax=Clathrus columnatus TaxID=1419009 RepID=A0AAV5ASP4_9AGAM|nr:hypothetical protein Clacol_009642 [Clathrus columnatus]